MLIIQALTVLGSVIAAVLAWAAKLQWSEEFKKAKEAQIQSLVSQINALKSSQEESLKAKEAQIQSLVSQISALKSAQEESLQAKEIQILAIREKLGSLQDMTSEKTKQFFEFTKSQLEAYNDELGLRVQELEGSITDKEELINSLSADQAQHHQKIEEIEKQKRVLADRLAEVTIDKKNLDSAIVSTRNISTEDINSESLESNTTLSNSRLSSLGNAVLSLAPMMVDPFVATAWLTAGKKIIDSRNKS